MEGDYSQLLKKLDYQFNDVRLFERALTHRSKSSDNYERLEFLGDSILGLTISGKLFDLYPKLSEGALTRLRATLVRKETLAKLARQLNLGDYLRLGSGELKSGGHNRDSILADALEAIFGAIYLDGGIEAARCAILKLYEQTLGQISPKTLQKDPKTRLQEYLQKHSQTLPQYRTLEVTGVAHKQHFVVECLAPGLTESVRGEGSTRRKAEQQAAARAFDILSGDSG